MADEYELISMKEAAALVGVTVQCAFGWHWRHVLHAEKGADGRIRTTPHEIRQAADIMARNPGGRKRLGERAVVEAEAELATVGSERVAELATA